MPFLLAGESRNSHPYPALSKMTSAFDDEELSMSMGGTAISRQPQRPAPKKPTHATEPVTNKIPADRRTAQRIGLYDVKRTLGEGSFGKVKLATHQVTKQEVALKIISRKKLISRDMAGRVERYVPSIHKPRRT